MGSNCKTQVLNKFYLGTAKQISTKKKYLNGNTISFTHLVGSWFALVNNLFSITNFCLILLWLKNCTKSFLTQNSVML